MSTKRPEPGCGLALFAAIGWIVLFAWIAHLLAGLLADEGVITDSQATTAKFVFLFLAMGIGHYLYTRFYEGH